MKLLIVLFYLQYVMCKAIDATEPGFTSSGSAVVSQVEGSLKPAMEWLQGVVSESQHVQEDESDDGGDVAPSEDDREEADFTDVHQIEERSTKTHPLRPVMEMMWNVVVHFTEPLRRSVSNWLISLSERPTFRYVLGLLNRNGMVDQWKTTVKSIFDFLRKLQAVPPAAA